MRFIIDAQLPPALARWLSAHGHPAEHVADCGLATADDRLIWDRAQRMGAVIVTKDEDFASRRALARDGPSVVWVRRGNTTRRELLAWFGAVFPRVVEALERGELLVEIT
jgi:predicted nuclease of predicted toxin-antitoxin system